MNNQHANIEFKPTCGTENKINYLDLLIIRQNNQLEIGIEKPTAVVSTIYHLLDQLMSIIYWHRDFC